MFLHLLRVFLCTRSTPLAHLSLPSHFLQIECSVRAKIRNGPQKCYQLMFCKVSSRQQVHGEWSPTDARVGRVRGD